MAIFCLLDGSEIGQNIETVNGDIKLEDVDIRRDISTVNGNIWLRDSTHVEGDIVYEKNNNGNDWGNSRPPSLRIEDSVVVDGDIVLHRPVDLDIPDEMENKVIRKYE